MVHCISVTSHYTYVWPYREINATNVAWQIKFRQQKMGEKNTNLVSCLQRSTGNYGQCRSSENEKAIMFGVSGKFNGTYLLSFPQKLQNSKYEHRDFTLWRRLHNDYNFYLNVTEWLASPGVTNFVKPLEKLMMFFWKGFARLQERKMAHRQFTKVYQWNPSGSRHWSFSSLAAAQQTVSFPVSLNPLSLRQNKVLEHLQKTSEKRSLSLRQNTVLEQLQKTSEKRNGQHCRRTRATEETVRNQLPMSRWRNCSTAARTDRKQKSRTVTKDWRPVSSSANEDERVNFRQRQQF